MTKFEAKIKSIPFPQEDLIYPTSSEKCHLKHTQFSIILFN